MIGDEKYTSLSHSVKDIKLNPSNNHILFAATDERLFKSVDGGNNFNTIMTGNFLEIEFHPNTADTMYFIRQTGDITEFYRSDDGGNTLTQYTNTAHQKTAPTICHLSKMSWELGRRVMVT